MASGIDEVAAVCSRTLDTGSMLLRGTPAFAAWWLGWLAKEFAPHVLTGHALSAIPSPLVPMASKMAAQRADSVLDAALAETFGESYHDLVQQPLEPYTARRPHVSGVVSAMLRRRETAITNISYGPGGRNHLLDIWRRPDLPEGHRAPVLIQVPGGAWTVNHKRGQAYPLMSRMVDLGWICVSINYSRSPWNAWPSHIVDVKRAIAWVRENIAGYGGDPAFIAVTGGSAGGHLSSLAALTAGDRSLQPGFEDADTTVQAAAPYYGVYDLTDHRGMHHLTQPLLERLVMRTRMADDPELFEDASPRFRVHRDAPPFFVLHGRDDDIVPLEQARTFTAALREAGAGTVAYAEIPNAHHAFDTIATLRCQHTTEAVAAFLGIVYGRHLAGARRGSRVRRSAS